MIIRYLDQVEYQPAWEQMKQFTDSRTSDTSDEIWVLEHTPVFTQGLAGKAEHLLNPGNIPVIQTDRGGQVTYHGPGQMVGYVLLDLVRMKIGIRTLVRVLEKSVINLLQLYGIAANTLENAPGVYVGKLKICSVGLKVRKGCTYHGIALNVSTDLSAFSCINPCGYKGLEMTNLNNWVPEMTIEEVAPLWVKHLLANLHSS